MTDLDIVTINTKPNSWTNRQNAFNYEDKL